MSKEIKPDKWDNSDYAEGWRDCEQQLLDEVDKILKKKTCYGLIYPICDECEIEEAVLQIKKLREK